MSSVQFGIWAIFCKRAEDSMRPEVVIINEERPFALRRTASEITTSDPAVAELMRTAKHHLLPSLLFSENQFDTAAFYHWCTENSVTVLFHPDPLGAAEARSRNLRI